MQIHSRLTPAIIVVVIWASLSTILGGGGTFESAPGHLPVALLLSLVLPIALFAIAYAGSEAFRRYVLGLDLRLLTAIQGWRIIGGMFLVLMCFHLLPGAFAWPAGVGDTIVGIYAPFVVYALVRRSPSWRRQVILLSILGLLDFVGAIGSGILAGDNPIGVLHGPIGTELMQRLPLSIIPTFGVPAWILVHWISLLKVTRYHVPELGTDGTA
jgi:hypothetical protein